MIATVSANIGDYSFSPTYEMHTLVEPNWMRERERKKASDNRNWVSIWRCVQTSSQKQCHDTYISILVKPIRKYPASMQTGIHNGNVLFTLTFNAKSMVIASPISTLAKYLRYFIKSRINRIFHMRLASALGSHERN